MSVVWSAPSGRDGTGAATGAANALARHCLRDAAIRTCVLSALSAVRRQIHNCYLTVTRSKYDRYTDDSILRCPSEGAGAQMMQFVASYVVLVIGIATVVIALSGALYGVVRLWTVDDKGEKDMSRGKWDWRWWRWWSMST
jgi:hypothetical protein